MNLSKFETVEELLHHVGATETEIKIITKAISLFDMKKLIHVQTKEYKKISKDDWFSQAKEDHFEVTRLLNPGTCIRKEKPIRAPDPENPMPDEEFFCETLAVHAGRIGGVTCTADRNHALIWIIHFNDWNADRKEDIIGVSISIQERDGASIEFLCGNPAPSYSNETVNEMLKPFGFEEDVFKTSD